MRVAIRNLANDAQSSSFEKLDLPDSQGSNGDDALRQFPALRGFVSSLAEEKDGPLFSVDYKLWNVNGGSEVESDTLVLRLELAIFHGDRAFGLAQYEDFASQLGKLLEREPGETVRVELQIVPPRRFANNEQPCLLLFLFAYGSSREQALMRCSFALARVQQALLFEARAVRQGRI